MCTIYITQFLRVCVRVCLFHFFRKLLIRWLRYFAWTIDMMRRCELNKMGSGLLVVMPN